MSADSLLSPATGGDPATHQANARADGVNKKETAEPKPSEAWWDHCPLCGTRLHNQGCKYRCPKCRYFMSCSDFD